MSSATAGDGDYRLDGADYRLTTLICAVVSALGRLAGVVSAAHRLLAG